MISISPRTYDTSGGVVFSESPGSGLRTGQRRVTRAKNLDGTVTIVDSGFAHGDRDVTFSVSAPTAAQVARVESIFQNSPLVTVSINDGVYIAAPESYRVIRGELTCNLLIKESS